MENIITVKEIKNATLRKATEATAEEITEEVPEDINADISSALHDMYTAYTRFCELVIKNGGIDPYNANIFASFVTTVNNTNLDDKIK